MASSIPVAVADVTIPVRHRPRRWYGKPSIVVPLAWILVLFVVALLGATIQPYDPDEQDLLRRLEGPSGDHWLGTDSFGRDILSRLLDSAAVSLLAVGIAVSIALAL